MENFDGNNEKQLETVGCESWFLKNKKVLFAASAIFLAVVGSGTFYYFHHRSHAVGIRLLDAQPEEVYGKIVSLKRIKDEYFIDYHNMFSNKVRQGIEYSMNWPLERTISYLRHEMKRERDGKTITYLIFDNKDNKLIGSLDVRSPDPEDPGQFGCWVNENYWGGGRLVEAFDLISKIYFAVSGTNEFTAEVRPWNKRSYGALMKCGFKNTGKFHPEGNPKHPDRHILIFRKQPRHNILPTFKK